MVAPSTISFTGNFGRRTPDQSQAQVIAASEAARGQVGAAQAGAVGGAAQARYGAIPGVYAPYAGMLGQAGGHMAQMFDSYGRNAGQYFNAIANLGANAMSSAQGVNTGLFNAYAGGNNAYQAMLGNLGAASLAGYGNAANSAMQAQAMNSTAFAKAMADAIAANQGAVSAYGVGRDQSLAALGGAMGAAGGNIANAFSQNASAAGQMAGTGSAALANLGGTLGTAAGNTASAGSQAEAAIRAASAGALGQLGTGTASAQAGLRSNIGSSIADSQAAQAQGLSNLGASANTALSGLGAPAANAAANDLNFTRDMAKLGLARELGLAGTNAMSGAMGAGGGGPIAFSVSGPQGQFASGSAPGVPGFGGGQSYVNPYANMPWYTQQQQSNQGGLQAIGDLRGGITGTTGNLAGQMQNFGGRALGMLADESSGGAADLRQTLGQTSGNIQGESSAGSRGVSDMTSQGLGMIGGQGQAAGQGIMDALMQGGRQIDDSFAGIQGASRNAFGGMNRAMGDIRSSGVLDQLNAGYGSGMGQLYSAFQQGQRDPADIFGQVRGDIEALSQPYMERGGLALDEFYRQFPEGPAWGGFPGGSVDPSPYLRELRSAYDPYISNLNSAYGSSFAGLLDMAGRAGQGFGSALGAIGDAPTLDGMFGKDKVGGQMLSTPSPYVDALGMTPAARIRQQQDAFREQQKLNAMRSAGRGGGGGAVKTNIAASRNR
jgi:hypothetical protein